MKELPTRSLNEAYDKQSILDNLLRYTQSRPLLELMARTIAAETRATRHLDVGFSGRLALFSCLTEQAVLINHSSIQIARGLELLEAQLSYFNQPAGSRSFSLGKPVEARLLREVERLLDEQMEVILAAGKAPVRPKDIIVIERAFRYRTPTLQDDCCDSLTMIDILIHLRSATNALSEIARTLATGGVSIVTFYPPSDAERGGGAYEPCVSELFENLCLQLEVPFDKVSGEAGCVIYPQRLLRLAARVGAQVPDAIARAHWLDLPEIRFHSAASVEEAAATVGLRIGEMKIAPGGMFRAHRLAATLHKHKHKPEGKADVRHRPCGVAQDLVVRTAAYVEQQSAGEVSGHDWWHIFRVWQTARKLAEVEGGDLMIIELAALLHDLDDWKLVGGDVGEAQRATEWLRQCGVAGDMRERICAVIHEVSFRGAGVASRPRTLEGMIVQDADRLDALGAIGIARAFAFGGFRRRPIHDPSVPPTLHQSFEQYRASRSTTLNHFHEKLLLLAERMNTDLGKRWARGRHQYMVEFLDRFLSEWSGLDHSEH